MRILLLLCLVAGLTNGQENILAAPGFETADFSESWFCQGDCGMTLVTDEVYTGQSSVLVTGRTANWMALGQNLELEGGVIYIITAYIQLANTVNESPYHDITTTLMCTDQTEEFVHIRLGLSPFIQPGDWHQVGGLLRVPEGLTDCMFYIETEANVDYYVDEASVVAVPDDEAWKTDALERTEELRKSDIVINIKMSGCGKQQDLTVELTQNEMSFPLGTAVDSVKIVDQEDPSNVKYQEVFYDNFNWAVLENKLKWRLMEWNRGEIDYDTPLTALDALIAHGIKTRCHAAFWGKDDNTPDWAKALSGDAFVQAVQERLDGIIGATMGMCDHWDVNNEKLHGDTLERQSGNINITMELFQAISDLDTKPDLFLNDFEVISQSDVTVAYNDMANTYIAAGVPVDGLGVQGHFSDIDLQLIKARLDFVAQSGLPIVISEMAINEDNVTAKAIALENLLTLFYGHPSVTGILFWGFWDGQLYEQQAALYEGPDVTPNEAGLAFENLINNVWKTSDTTVINKSSAYTVRGTKGSYTLTVKRNGEVLKTTEFELGDTTKRVLLKVGSGGRVQVMKR